MSIHVDCLRAEHWVGTDRFPLFIGFMTASQLAAIAEAPQFSLTTDHEVIAGNVTAVPVREWQRPIDRERVDEIARIFAAEAEIMPNAVLLAAPDPTRLRLRSQGAGDLWLLEIPTSAGEPKPIWVLDGQHRIAGLAQSKTPAKTPFVLLASHGHSAKYQESTFAKIFAQVTTTAEGLHPLHNEWLTFAFALGQYDDTNPIVGHANALHQKSMETAVHLCHERHLDAARTASNPFFNRVAFNPKSIKRKAPSPQVGPVAGGFQMDATMVERLVFTSYFGHKDMPAGPLTAKEVASQIGYAYEALVSCHPGADRARSVFLSPVGSPGALGHRALQEGFLHGVLRHLARNGVPSDWPTVLRSRAFDTTDWTDKSWGRAARGGAEGNLNKKLARRVFERLLGDSLPAIFPRGSVVPAALDLGDYFRGQVGFGFDLQARRRSPVGRLLKFSGKTDPFTSIESGMVKTRLPIDGLRSLSVANITPNVFSVGLADISRPFEKIWTWSKLRGGMELTADHLHANPVTVRFELTFYGGEKKDLQVVISYT